MGGDYGSSLFSVRELYLCILIAIIKKQCCPFFLPYITLQLDIHYIINDMAFHPLLFEETVLHFHEIYCLYYRHYTDLLHLSVQDRNRIKLRNHDTYMDEY